MTKTKVYLLDFGSLVMDGYMMFWGRGPGGPFRFPTYGVLIDHAEGRFLFDTGYDGGFFARNLPFVNVDQSARQTVPGQLDLIGLRPKDITHVLNSHYHVDHVGGNHHCTHATTICHKCELEAYDEPEPWEAMGYSDRSVSGTSAANDVSDRADDIYTPRFELISGDARIAKGVTLFETPGHTPGHYSLMVELADRRPMLFTGDACYTQRSLEENIIANSHSDVKQSFASLERLRQLAEEHDAELFYSHDPARWAEWKPAPYHYS
ncbi:N-acyl homoserine lactonase family protein [Rhizorhabdus wittichii]|uniref:N-acyl homoserine lactonase family protein n=1 Tax=Rhizorhabdus wittichii TaxID=160791 RepID=A0A975D3S2_9SPHN|nr:N-acyl homoserine lactonase family protein [Rhizorhabdus wittichii]QTH21130.1 N-acyl homoserine lactonase family protein [Rhizorhabdus wittichii]